mmetsp:Transcript_48382/g.127326  ORF Transcript_48382/g.127326 Transcript_48382/m.127326 type:complete len:229 (-) Transcript_48382:397-1083(-)
MHHALVHHRTPPWPRKPALTAPPPPYRRRPYVNPAASHPQHASASRTAIGRRNIGAVAQPDASFTAPSPLASPPSYPRFLQVRLHKRGRLRLLVRPLPKQREQVGARTDEKDGRTDDEEHGGGVLREALVLDDDAAEQGDLGEEADRARREDRVAHHVQRAREDLHVLVRPPPERPPRARVGRVRARLTQLGGGEGGEHRAEEDDEAAGEVQPRAVRRLRAHRRVEEY